MGLELTVISALSFLELLGLGYLGFRVWKAERTGANLKAALEASEKFAKTERVKRLIAESREKVATAAEAKARGALNALYYRKKDESVREADSIVSAGDAGRAADFLRVSANQVRRGASGAGGPGGEGMLGTGIPHPGGADDGGGDGTDPT